jgi:hypothetical protein
MATSVLMAVIVCARARALTSAKYTWVTTQRVLFEFLAGLKQVTARHVFGEIQHVTHNLGLQGKWIHIVYL